MADDGYLLAVVSAGTGNQSNTNIGYTSGRLDNFQLRHFAIRGPDRRTKFHHYGYTHGTRFYRAPLSLGRCRVVIPEDSFDQREAVHTADALVHSDGAVFVREDILSSENQMTLNGIEQIVPSLYKEFSQSF